MKISFWGGGRRLAIPILGPPRQWRTRGPIPTFGEEGVFLFAQTKGYLDRLDAMTGNQSILRTGSFSETGRKEGLKGKKAAEDEEV